MAVATADARPGTAAEGRSDRATCISTASPAAAMPPTPRITRSCRSAWWCRARSRKPNGRSRFAARRACSVLPRGGGTSQAGQTVNHSLVVDCSKHLNRILDLDVAGRALRGRARHRARRPQPRSSSRTACGFRSTSRPPRAPPSAAWPATIPAAAARCATATRARTCSRSTRCWPTARKAHFGPVGGDLSDLPDDSPLRPLARDLLALGAREADEIAARFPKVQRRVGGYNLDALVPGRNDVNLAHILVGSEGTLAFSTAIELKLSPLLGRRAVGACHFGSFHEAMEAAQHIVKLAPDRGRAGRPHHDRARARHRHVPADARGVRARRARGDPAGRVRRGRPGRERRAACKRLARADGRSRLRLGPERRRMGRRGRGARSRSCRPRSPSCAPPASTS